MGPADGFGSWAREQAQKGVDQRGAGLCSLRNSGRGSAAGARPLTRALHMKGKQSMSCRDLSRREFLNAAAFAGMGLSLVGRQRLRALAVARTARYVPPPSPRATFNFNLDWKFMREDVTDGEAPGLDDSAWATVSTPHTVNDVDSFRKIISHSGGDVGTYKGLAWYRKHFRLLPGLADRRVFLEFEGMRQAGDIFLNGKEIGLYENGITAYGVDITEAVQMDGQENVLAVKEI